jgi:hypothetical protein
MKPMSEYNPGDNISNEPGSIDSNQTTSDSDGDGSAADAVRERSEHLGAVEIDVSSSVTAYHYDDEPDSLLLTIDDSTIRVSPSEARSLVADTTAALDAIATERAEEDP